MCKAARSAVARRFLPYGSAARLASCQFLEHAFGEALVEPAHARLVLAAREPAQGVGGTDAEALDFGAIHRTDDHVAVDVVVAGHEAEHHSRERRAHADIR